MNATGRKLGKKTWHAFCITLIKVITMKKRNVIYFSKSKALKILEHPTQVDLQTLLSATFAISRNRIVKKHIEKTLHQLTSPVYKLTA